MDADSSLTIFVPNIRYKLTSVFLALVALGLTMVIEDPHLFNNTIIGGQDILAPNVIFAVLLHQQKLVPHDRKLCKNLLFLRISGKWDCRGIHGVVWYVLRVKCLAILR